MLKLVMKHYMVMTTQLMILFGWVISQQLQKEHEHAVLKKHLLQFRCLITANISSNDDSCLIISFCLLPLSETTI